MGNSKGVKMKYKRILIIEPHPDDMILMSGGLVARAMQEGAEVYVLTLTTGGGAASKQDKDAAMATQRTLESRIADKILGIVSGEEFVHGIQTGELVKRTILGYGTRKLNDNQSVVYNDVLKEIRTIKPDLIITTQNDHKHPDHRYIAENIEEIVYQAGENIRVEELGEPVKANLWFGENPRSQLKNENLNYIDISDTLDLKLGALAAQESQIPVLGKEIFNDVRDLAKYRGMRSGAEYAEAFKEIKVYKDST